MSKNKINRKLIIVVVILVGLFISWKFSQEIISVAKENIPKNTPLIIGRKQEECQDIFIRKSKENNSSITFCSGKTKYQTDLKGKSQET